MDLLITEEFATIDKKDPCLLPGFTPSFDKTVNIELRVEDSPGNTSIEPIRVRILSMQEFQGTTVKIELSSERDIFFNYACNLTDSNFVELLNSQKLMIDFASLPTTLGDLLDSCQKDPANFVAILVMDREGNARLDLIQNFAHKLIELLSLKFQEKSEDGIRQQVVHRYEATKSKYTHLLSQLEELNSLFKRKDQSLYTNMHRAFPQKK